MEDVKVQYCKLCLTTIHGDDFKAIDNDTKDILGILLLKQDDEYKHVMCNVCSAKLFAAHEFKLTCTRIDVVINSYADDATMLPLDLRQIYMKQSNYEHISNDTKICRLCMQPIKNIAEFNLINEEQVGMIMKFIPEMNIFIIKEPVMCKCCQDTLIEHCNFLKKCSDVEQNIGCISNEQILEAPSPAATSVNMSVKIENFDDEFEEKPHLIKTESMEINYEDVVSKSEIYGQEAATSDFNDFETKEIFPLCSHEITNHKQSDFEKDNHETMDETILEKRMMTQEDSSVYSCAKCDYKTTSKRNLQPHFLKHKAYRCEICKFDSTDWNCIKNHMLIHEGSSEVQIHKCEKCNHEAKFSTPLMLAHEGPSEVQMYRCGNCNHESKCKGYVKYMLTNIGPPGTQMFRCTTCSYETKYGRVIKRHLLSHKDSSEVRMYKCDICYLTTKYKECLKRHMLTHHEIQGQESATSKKYKKGYYKTKEINLNSHEIAKQSNFEKYDHETLYEATLEKRLMTGEDSSVYSCEKCDYKTLFKGNLKSHLLKHKDPSEVPMYKCTTCNYETKYQASIKRHLLTHSNPAGMQNYIERYDRETVYEATLEKRMKTREDSSVYSCEKCDYKTTSRGNLKLHILKHKDPSEVQMYKCSTCNYETKYQRSIKRHLITHSDPAGVQNYKCEICNFETKDWKCIKNHMSTHEHSSEVQIYKCEKCNHENKYNSALDHKGPSEAQMYKCGNCNYESKCKGYVKYTLTNIVPPETQMYRCASCSYETKYVRSVKSHLLRHKDPSEVRMYKCDKCDHKTKYKTALKKHLLTHVCKKQESEKSRNLILTDG